jgi:hypothetical protein
MKFFDDLDNQSPEQEFEEVYPKEKGYGSYAFEMNFGEPRIIEFKRKDNGEILELLSEGGSCHVMYKEIREKFLVKKIN